MNFCF